MCLVCYRSLKLSQSLNFHKIACLLWMAVTFCMLSSGLQMPHNDKICNSYVSYVRHHFGFNTVVVFDGYESNNSTKAPEQQRRASKGVSRDLLFDEQMKTISTQASF